MKLKIFLSFFIAVFVPLFPVSAATLTEMSDGEGNKGRIEMPYGRKMRC